MARHSEDELIDSLTRLVAMWRTAQRNDGKIRPLVGRLDLRNLDADTYVVKSMLAFSARIPSRPSYFRLSVIEALIHLGYLYPSEGPRAVTYLHPTMDAFFLADVATHQAFRVLFHRRYKRLRAT